MRVEVGVFEVLADPATLLAKLYGTENNNSPLADHNIPYHPRDPDRDIQAELRQALNSTRYLLITARSGVGKTREAATLAHSLMNEGFRVLRVNPGWLDAPKELPRELRGDRRRILILLDDLNGLFRAGGYVQSPKAEQMPMLGQPSYHDRLLAALDAFEKMCGQSEIRVIATARDEADEWEKLNFNERDALWKRFARFELPALPANPTIELLKDLTARADMRAEADDFPTIARANDGTFKNVVVNLQRLPAENKSVTAENYTPTLGGTWQDVYQRAVRQHSAVRYIYDAVDILRQAGIEPYLWIVRPTARMLWGGDPLQKLIRRYRIERGLRYLVNERKILPTRGGRLSPYDGQIEAKGTRADWQQHVAFLHDLILRLADSQPKVMLDSLVGLGSRLFSTDQYCRLIAVSRRATEIAPQVGYLWSNLGVALDKMGRPADAEEAFRQALARDPNHAAAYYNLGFLLYKLERYPEAEEAYRQALARDPNDAQAYSNLGSLLDDLKRYPEAEEAYRDAIQRDPDLAMAYSNLGSLLDDLERYPEAEEAYRQAIARDPNLDEAYNNLGVLLRKLERYPEAEEMYRKGLDISPNDTSTLNNLIFLLRLTGRLEEASPLVEQLRTLGPTEREILLTIAGFCKQTGDSKASTSFAAQARALIPADDWHNLACLESICGDVDAAIEHLRRAAAKDGFDREWARRDPDLEWIRADERFEEIGGQGSVIKI